MPRSYWTYAFRIAIFVLSRVPSKVLNFQSYFRCYIKVSLTIYFLEFLKVYAILPFVLTEKSKLDAKSASCVLIGYAPYQRGYLCLEKSTSKIFTSRHMAFAEHIFPYAVTSTSVPSPTS